MKLTEAILDYLWSLGEAKAMLRAPNTLVPFVAFSAILALWLIASAFFAAPLLSAFMVPAVRALSGENALHYPMNFVLLSRTYHLVYFPLVVLLGFVLFGVAVFRMGDHYETLGKKVGVRPHVGRSIPSMIILGLAVVVVATAPPLLFGWLADAAGGGLPGRALGLTGQGLAFAGQVLLVYSLVSLRRGEPGPVRAIRRGIATGRRRFWPTMFIVVTVFLAHWPLNGLLAHPDKVVLRFSPELVFYLLMAGIVLELATNYLIFASTTALALARREEGLQ